MKASTSDRDRGFRRTVRAVRRGAKTNVDVGWREGRHPSGLTLAELATIHEYGAPGANIPARPVLGPVMDKNRARYAKEIRDRVARALEEGRDVEPELAKLGERMRNDVVKYITTARFRPLKASTIRRKGSSRPLIDTGAYRDGVSYRVTVGARPR